MKVIFVASGNKAVGTVSSFVQSQYDSLADQGLEMIMFPVVGHGVKGYIKHLFALRRLIREERPDIVHAHYSVCGYLASLASFGLFGRHMAVCHPACCEPLEVAADLVVGLYSHFARFRMINFSREKI